MERDKFLEMANAYNTMKKQQFELLKEYTLEYSELQDADDYPTKDCLTLISEWHHSDPTGWFEFINQQWYATDWGWSSNVKPHRFKENEFVMEHNVSTAGWSGNEAIIRAMEKNNMLWWMTWVQSPRGGHYIFEVEMSLNNKND
jgi:hypothetical protein